MNVTLPPELQKLIENEVKSGRAPSVDEFLSNAIYHYVLARNLGEEYTRDELDGMIDAGLADISRGATIDGEEAFRQLRAYSAERRRQRA